MHRQYESKLTNWKPLRAIAALAGLALCFALPASAQYSINGPNGIAFDSKGHLWLANSSSNQILELQLTSGSSTATVLNSITSGISSPTRLCFDASGNLWVTNIGSPNTVTEYNNLTAAGGTLVNTVALSGFGISRPLGLAVDSFGDLYVSGSDSNNVVALDVDFNLIETLTQDKSGFPFTGAATMAINGQDIYVGFGPGAGPNGVISYNGGQFLTDDPKEVKAYGTTDGVNTGPTGIAFDTAGNVYVSDFFSSSWVKYLPDGTRSKVVTAGVAQPEGIAFRSGTIYVSNSSTNTIPVYSASSGALKYTINSLN